MTDFERLGIYGGTFSPPHNGHLYAASTFLNKINLDRLLIIPTCIPPHKEVVSNNPKARLEMTEIAFSELTEYGKKIFVDDFEYVSGGKSYTANTLEHFSSKNRHLFFLCGTDMFLTLDSWYRPDKICRLATIVVMGRYRGESKSAIDAYAVMLKNKYDASISIIDAPPLEISSSQIRDAVAKGNDISGMVPDSVCKYIEENKLYRNERIGYSNTEK